jgi:hypothetical protein
MRIIGLLVILFGEVWTKVEFISPGKSTFILTLFSTDVV